MYAYIVKTPDGYLYPFADDVSLTDDQAQAGHYRSAQEAREVAESRGYYDGGFDVIRVEIDQSKLNQP